MPTISSLRRLAAAFVATVLLPAGQAFAQGPGQAPPPPAVTVMTVAPQTIPVTYEYAGRVEASRLVEVRARVAGILLQRTFEEGARVQQGDVLFQIDKATYEAQVAQAQALILQAQAQLGQARLNEERARALAQRGASSQANLDDAVSARKLAEAQLAAQEANARTSALSLEYATVKAPASGITSLEQVPEGSLLAVGDLLTRITQLDPVYVNFSAADTEARSIRQLVENGTLQGASKPEDLSVEILFGDGTTYPQKGTIDFTSTSIDATTGTILSRAVLPNGESRLLPGQFVRLRLTGLSIENAVAIPTEALMQGPQGTFVYTIAEGNVAKVKPVDIGRELEGGRLIVRSGLSAGDKVITEGVVKVRPDAPVQPSEAPAAAAPMAAGEPAGTQPAPASGETPAGAPAAAQAGERRSEAGPPVPLESLPSGSDAREAAAAGRRTAEAAR
ncbi:efflux RND transporter periplasmic adaptor subunit [Aurantimonas sp. Leaf443]|uniref:efflux RND transporter periplasmic adaptor subunit n=1 Tax=Aurantimonas sp. Leaf443 TaxID=1736378 RepID=UPI0006FC8F44|nr:efflux RND transporter periplasmic adaptor subunit [Aurantimonas sp. Leaf443]KQT88197.1 hemolysin D [Aurantimonas sp. Leaf443]